MGIVDFVKNKIVEKVVKAGVVVAGAITSAIIQNNREKKKDKFIKDEVSGHTKLLLSQNLYKLKEDFKVYDSNEKLKYIVKGKLFSATHDLTVYDATGKIKLGRVVQKLIALRSPLSLEHEPKDFVLYINDQKIGKIKSKFSLMNYKFKCDFNNWAIEGDFIGNVYKIRENDRLIMNVEKTLAIREDLYFIDILSEQDELLCLLIALAIDSSKSSKAKENKRAFKKMFWI